MKMRGLVLTTLLTPLLFGACGDDPAPPVADDPAPPAAIDLVDTAVAAGSFETLVAAVQAADLVATLKGPGPFTIFAPTDAAFEALPAGTLESLLLPANQGQLADILTYHVVPGRLMASDVLAATSLTTVLGQDLAISLMDGSPFVNMSGIVQTDIEASNGVIHVIDAVLLPQ